MASVDSPYTYNTPSPLKPHHSRSEHKRQKAEHVKPDSESSKRDTEHYLQYYTSSIADGRTDETDQTSRSAQVVRRTSGTSSSSSDYSDSQIHNVSTTEPLARRRSTAPSNGGSDRRRLAIVEVDPLDDPPPKKSMDGRSQSSSFRSRRAAPASLDGLALVAPPDAAPKSYSHLTPPTTGSPAPDAFHDAAHDGNGYSKPSTTGSNVDVTTTGLTRPHMLVEGESLVPPNDQRSRHSTSPSPSVIPGISDRAHGLLSPSPNTPSGTQPLIVTPEIGEEKEIGVPVAAPVVINLSSAGPFRRKDSSKQKDMATAPASAQLFQERDYLNYQPGVHATAGPLPPPPRAMFNIDTSSPAPPRPPRLNSPHSTRSRGDIEAVKQALQLPSSVTAVLASKSSSTKHVEPPETNTIVVQKVSGKTVGSTSDTELHHVKLGHKREGAFPPSTSTSTVSDSEVSQPITNPVVSLHDDTRTTNFATSHSASDPDVPPITVVNAMTPIEEQKEYPGADKTHDVDVMSTPSAKRRTSDQVSLEKDSPSQSPPSNRQTPSPPPKSFRNSLTTNLKRLSSSLPRTPSLSSKSRRSSSTVYSSRTPSPSIHMTQPLPIRSKIVSQYPPAMFYAEMTTRKTSLERCALYAQKINELYTYDSGLGEWTIETKLRNNKASTGSVSSHIFTPQPRHTSRASMLSEATFPRRPDASTATDLSVKIHGTNHSTPPTLPYPSLMNQRAQPSRTSSIASGTPPSSLRSLAPSTPTPKSSGGFFASLGRKASMTSSKKDKAGPSSPATNTQPARLVKSPPINLAPRAINITNTPSVPGGPRAVPNHRAMRSKTILTTTSPFASNAASPERNEELTRRPSLTDLGVDVVLDISADPEFARQVDKLADLLPNANRSVLAGYLRRAGQDILAIGQYLEDEKNGTIKAP